MGAQQSSGLPQEAASYLERHRRVMHKDGNYGKDQAGYCEMVLNFEGEVLYYDTQGVLDKSLKPNKSFDHKSIVRLYSMTKPLVATAFLFLLQDGLIPNVDVPVANYIPEFANLTVQAWNAPAPKPATAPITLKMLIAHSAGFGYGPGPAKKEPMPAGKKEEKAQEARYKPLVDAVERGDVKDIGDFCRELAKIPLFFNPGTAYMYGYGVDVLGHIMEVVTKQPLDEYLRQRLFEPLAMVDTGFAVGPEKLERLSVQYIGSERWDYIRGAPEKSRWFQGNQCPVLSGGGLMGHNSGGLVSTAEDYARFLMMIANKGKNVKTGEQVLRADLAELAASDWLLSGFPDPDKIPGWSDESMGRDPDWVINPGDGTGCVGFTTPDGFSHGGFSGSRFVVYPLTRLIAVSASEQGQVSELNKTDTDLFMRVEEGMQAAKKSAKENKPKKSNVKSPGEAKRTSSSSTKVSKAGSKARK